MSDESAQSAVAMATLVDQTHVFIEAGEGIRARLLEGGWSEEAAEELAAVWLAGAMQAIWTGEAAEEPPQ